MARRPRDRYGRPLPPGSSDELPAVEVHVEGGGRPTDLFERAIDRFNEQRFFEAHELFESIWNSPETSGRDRLFWKGVTQVAVGCCHIQRGNARGAALVLRRAADNVAGYPSPHRGIETRTLIDLARRLADRAEHGSVEHFVQFPSFPSV